MYVIKQKKKVWDLTKRAKPAKLKDTVEHFLRKQEANRPWWLPEWDAPRSTPATQLVVALKELGNTERKLAEKHIEHEEECVDLELQWEDLREKELSLHALFQKYDRFVVDNADKRERASRKIDEQIIRQQELESQISNLSVKRKEIEKIKIILNQKVKENSIYDRYLLTFVQENSDFKMPIEVLHRYIALIETRRRLGDRQFIDLDATEKIKTDLFLAFNNQNTQMMTIYNRLIELQNRYAEAKQKADFWEQTIIQIKLMASKRKDVDNQIMKSCWNVYQQICKRKGLPIRLARNETLDQLIVIKKTYKAIEKTVKMAIEDTQRNWV